MYSLISLSFLFIKSLQSVITHRFLTIKSTQWKEIQTVFATFKKNETHPFCSVFTGDITEEATCKEIVTETVEKFGRIDILINNAGVPDSGPIESAPIENFDKVMAVNLRSVVRLFINNSIASEKRKAIEKFHCYNIKSVFFKQKKFKTDSTRL